MMASPLFNSVRHEHLTLPYAVTASDDYIMGLCERQGETDSASKQIFHLFTQAQ